MVLPLGQKQGNVSVEIWAVIEVLITQQSKIQRKNFKKLSFFQAINNSLQLGSLPDRVSVHFGRICTVLVTCASFSNQQLTDNKAPSGRWIGCIYEVMSVGQEVRMMNGGRPRKRCSFPCQSVVAVADVGGSCNLGITISTGGAALSGKWLCNRKLTPAAAIKVVVAGSSLSRVAT